MENPGTTPPAPLELEAHRSFAARAAPFLRAPEGARTVFGVTLAAACAPLLAGLLFFGWRAAVVAGLAVGSCAVIERLYYRVSRVPALLGRSHAYLTGVLLALTLPPFVPWYVPVIAAAFAIIVGKAVFGGVGHFLWQPALVGRLAVAVLLPWALDPPAWPLLAQDKLLIGSLPEPGARAMGWGDYRQWRGTAAPEAADGFLLKPPAKTLAGLTSNKIVMTEIHPPGLPDWLSLPFPMATRSEPAFSALVFAPVEELPLAFPGDYPLLSGPYLPSGLTHAIVPPASRPAPLDPSLGGAAPSGSSPVKPAALLKMPPLSEMLYGARPGGLGETSAIVIVVAGLYLVYRNYVKWHLPVCILLAACGVLAVAPVNLAGPYGTTETVWWPVTAEGLDVGFLYLLYHLLSGEMLLAAFFLATEMTSRPVTTGGQVIFGLACGVIAALLKLYVDTSIPAYLAVLVMNTFTPTIDAVWRPRVFGQKRFWSRWFSRKPSWN